MAKIRHTIAALAIVSRVMLALNEQLLLGCEFFSLTEGNCSDLVAQGLAIQEELDVAFMLCEGSEVEEVFNGFAVTLRMFLSPDGVFYVHAATLRPGRHRIHLQTNHVRFQWQAAAKELSLKKRHFGTVGVFGQACGNVDTMVWPPGEWYVPRVKAQPQHCFQTPLAHHCCQPMRPQCWGYNQLLTFACCSVPYETASTSTCLVSNPVYPNKNQDCRGQPLNFFRAFADGNELKVIVGGRILKHSDINASLATGCLLQSVIYLFHELHHLSHNGEWLVAIPVQRLVGYVRLFQELLERCDLEGQMFYHLTGLLPEQMLYLVWLSTGRRYHWLLDTLSLPGRPMVVDVGAAGGLDSSLYLALGARVVAYEANLFAYNCTASRLEPALRRGLLQLHSAKISRGRGHEEFVGSIHALDFERAGEAELPKYTADRFANTVQLLATSCADIIVEQGTPFYMKIDVEDATKMCLDSLGEIVETSRPALISAEIEDETVLMRLAALGYQSFKIVRQSPHGFLRSTASGACALHGAKLLKESATGLFGDFATDLITGAEWQSFADALDLYTTVANPHVRSAVAAWFPSANSEWYDVHARRIAP
ncbi:unnamed protein product, partial [Symbiodinium sp. CCMP2456]